MNVYDRTQIDGLEEKYTTRLITEDFTQTSVITCKQKYS